MIGFFVKRPAMGVFGIIIIWVAGGVYAHQQKRTGKTNRSTKALSLIKKRTPPAIDWRKKLDLGRVKLVDEQYVQTTSEGTKITLTLDPKLQKWAKEYLASYELPYAGMVMMDVKKGDVLVMAGHSSRSKRVSTEELCLTPWAPSASVFKLITAAALLDKGVSANTEVCYHGGFSGLKKHHITDNEKLDSSCRTLSFAIAKSINPIMGKLALKHLSQRSLQKWSRRFAFNRPIPFDFPVQPSKAEIPAKGLALAKVAAGFWKTESSVLHGALIAGVAATGGLMRWPRAVKEIKTADGKVIIPRRPDAERVMSRSAARKLAKMMVNTTTIGTARRSFISRRGRAFLPGIDVGGKTGSLSRKKPYLHYNWFVGFAPADKPEVAFAVLVGNPAKWRIKAHTAARAALTQYFKNSAEEKALAKKKRAMEREERLSKTRQQERQDNHKPGLGKLSSSASKSTSKGTI